jgi:hypothetical protein
MRKLLCYLFITLLLSFLVGGTALAAKSGGGSPEPTGVCTDFPPAPTSGPYVVGTFTAGLDLVGNAMNYVVHSALAYQWKAFVFSGSIPADYADLNSLCELADDNPALLAAFKDLGCGWGVAGIGTPFGLTGYPVITKIKVIKKDHCGTSDAMITGTVTVRIVPW